jgi:nitric-oxide synthase
MGKLARRLASAGVNYAGRTSPLLRRLRKISALERREEARAFLELFCQETGVSRAALEKRWAEISRALRRRNFYEHTPEELAFGARVAWRNHGRCIGRLFWESLEVFDCRKLTEPDAIADRMIRHMQDALGDGRIRSMISVFAPVEDTVLPAYIESKQITEYAGYTFDDGSVLGDRQNVEATRIAQSLGWQAPEPKGRFDMLPVIIRDRNDRRALFSVPPSAYREIEIRHPTEPGLADLNLKWYALPCLTAMILTIGGIDYPCAPFNGFYMCTEIASRDFADRKRYDLLPDVARVLGDEPEATKNPFWRDTALTELNRAVVHSFREAGVTMVDHHAASEQFMEFHRREQAQGRRVAADWRWIVPPQASGVCEVFHLRMTNFHPVPNYYNAETSDGRRLMPFYGDRHRSRAGQAFDRLQRRWKLWKRMAW